MTLGSRKFYKNEPVLYFDTLKTSSLEGAATTVYATGGRGNTRLVAWEGERTLTFTMEDALISPESFSILSGAGLISATQDKPAYVHVSDRYEATAANTIELPQEACWNKYEEEDEYYQNSADIFVMTLDDNGRIDDEPCVPAQVGEDHKTVTCYGHHGGIKKGDIVLVDYYVKKIGNTQTIEITADKFGGNYYLEASTLFREESTGVDMPAEFVIPNCKVQSNFTFTMAATGDPSTFTFTMDAFPDYTKFDRTHKVLAAIQVISDDVDAAEETRQPCAEGSTLVIGRDLEDNAGYGSKLMSDLCEDDVEMKWDGVKATVTGTFKPVTEWNDLPGGSDRKPSVDKPMYFYTVDLDDSIEGKPFQCFKDGKPTTLQPVEAGEEELFWVLNLSETKNYRFESDGKVIADIDLSQATLKPYKKAE